MILRLPLIVSVRNMFADFIDWISTLISRRVSPFPKRCSCGRVHRTREAWSRLQWVGFQDDGFGGLLAMRNCVCNTSLVIPAPHDDASTRVCA